MKELKNYIQKNTIIALVALVSLYSNALGQSSKPFPKLTSADVTLDTGKYIVRGNNVIAQNVTLTIKPGTELFFERNAIVQVFGGLDIQGTPGNFITITSNDLDNLGMGFLFQDESQQSIHIEYADFTFLKRSLKFSKNWLRSSVNISNNMFHDLNNGIYFEIQEVDKILIQNDIDITIASNTFGNNAGSFMITDAAWDQVHFTIKNNVFSRNEFIGRELNGIFTTPLFLNYNEPFDDIPQPTIEDNSVSFNYVGLISHDTVEFLPVYLTSVGTADKLDISPNYFGKEVDKYLEMSAENIQSMQRAPYLIYKNTLQKPLESNNGHVYKVGVNGVEIDNPSYDIRIDEKTEVIELINNKPGSIRSDFTVTYIYLENDTIRRYGLKNKVEMLNGGLKIKIKLNDKIVKRFNHGYLEIAGIEDPNGFLFPMVSVGLKTFLNENREYLVNVFDYMAIPRMDIGESEYQLKPLDSLKYVEIDTNIEIDTNEILKREKYWDFEIQASSTVYFGDLVTSTVSFFLPNARPHFGFRVGYNLNEHLRVQVRQNTSMLAGDDKKTSTIGQLRGTNFARGLSFRTMVYDLGVGVNYAPLSSRKMKGFIPSVHAGISGYYFNPQAEYEGKYYNLRKVGTEGQTLDGSKYAYQRFAVSIPFGFQIERHISQKMVLGFAWTYHKLFTDYLDDVSTGEFPDAESLKAVNPDLGDVAVKLSNPNNITGGPRSSSADNDGYAYFGLTCRWKL